MINGVREESELPRIRRFEVLTSVHSALREAAGEFQAKALETMQSKAGVDGPWQSKQPDEMIRIELQAEIYKRRALDYLNVSKEIENLLVADYKNDGRVKLGSVLVWEIRDSEHAEPVKEVVIVTRTGGGEFGWFRLLCEKTPVAVAITGKSVGDIVVVNDYTIYIKDVL